MTQQRIYLASQSPRRAELLQQIGVEFERIDVDVPEVQANNEMASDFVQRLAREKAQAGWQACDKHYPVLGADTIVVLNDDILGKPHSPAGALRMLASLSGTTHTVMTAMALVNENKTVVRLNCSQVTFREISESERKHYVATGEPLDKAGAYAVQGRAAAFIESIQGSYSGIMGLALYEMADLLEQFGISVI